MINLFKIVETAERWKPMMMPAICFLAVPRNPDVDVLKLN